MGEGRERRGREREGRHITSIPTPVHREVLDYIFIKNDLEVDWTPPTHSFTVTMKNGMRTTPDLDLPTQNFAGCCVEIHPLEMDVKHDGKKVSGLY